MTPKTQKEKDESCGGRDHEDGRDAAPKTEDSVKSVSGGYHVLGENGRVLDQFTERYLIDKKVQRGMGPKF